MTQRELKIKLNECLVEEDCEYGVGCTHLILSPSKVVDLINQHVAEVIGEDDKDVIVAEGYEEDNNLLRAEQRKRAGLTPTKPS